MNGKTLKIIKICTSFALGLLFLFTSLFTYREHMPEAYELTFLSSFGAGICFVLSGFSIFFDREFPPIVYLCASVLLLIVFFVCIAFVNQFRFDGGFAFLHVVNPLLALLYYLILCDMRGAKMRFVPLVSAVPLAYLVFVIIFGSVTGNFIYFFMNYKQFGIWYPVVFILAILAGIFAVGYALYFLNRLLQRAIWKN